MCQHKKHQAALPVLQLSALEAQMPLLNIKHHSLEAGPCCRVVRGWQQRLVLPCLASEVPARTAAAAGNILIIQISDNHNNAGMLTDSLHDQHRHSGTVTAMWCYQEEDNTSSGKAVLPAGLAHDWCVSAAAYIVAGAVSDVLNLVEAQARRAYARQVLCNNLWGGLPVLCSSMLLQQGQQQEQHQAARTAGQERSHQQQQRAAKAIKCFKA
jgi:hypothetical protein